MNAFCPAPFEHFEINGDGEVLLCCPAWLNVSAGNVYDGDFAKVWNSEKAQRIRRSILDGRFEFCSRDGCALLKNGALRTRESYVDDPDYGPILAANRTALERGPRILSLGYDTACNLRCPSCRIGVEGLKGAGLERATALQERLFSDAAFLAAVRNLIVTGYGDPFASPLYRQLLREVLRPERFPNVRLTVMTNGLLLTPEEWRRIGGCHGMIERVSVSIDAATEATYRKVRGGDFNRVWENVRFLTRETEQRVEVSFVVQAANYREMPAFARMGLEAGCVAVSFFLIDNRGAYQAWRDYRKVAVHLPIHPEHTGLLRAVRDPIFADRRVGLTNLAHLRGPAAVLTWRQAMANRVRRGKWAVEDAWASCGSYRSEGY